MNAFTADNPANSHTKAVPAAESIQGSADSGTFTLLFFASASSYTGVGSLDLKV
jgi:hypothetical protein